MAELRSSVRRNSATDAETRLVLALLVLHLARDALAEGVATVVVGAVLLMEALRVGVASGLALLGGVLELGHVLLDLVLHLARDTLAEGVLAVVVGAVLLVEALRIGLAGRLALLGCVLQLLGGLVGRALDAVPHRMPAIGGAKRRLVRLLLGRALL